MKFRKIKLLFLSILSIVASGCAPEIEYVDVLNFPQFSFEIIDRDECKVSASQAFDLTEAVIPKYVKINSNNYIVTSIGDLAFYECTSLTSIIIPNSVTLIGQRVFYGCSSLTSITIPNSVISIGRMAFLHCSSLTSITIPNSVTSIAGAAFSSCSSLTSVTIGNNVTSLGDYAFEYCSSLTSIIIPNSVTSIGYDAFKYCSSLTIYCEAKSKPSGWKNTWNSSNRPVYWAGQWVYVKGVPTPIN